VVLIGHTTKGKHGSVEATIAGSTVMQNLSKAIFIFGPEPGSKAREEQREMEDGEVGNPTYVFACERMGIAGQPSSLLFTLETKYDEVTKRNEPYLVYLGPSGFNARDVLDEAKTDDRGDRDANKTAQAAYWIKETLMAKGPMPTTECEKLAKADGVYGSKNTFDRARKIAAVQTGRRGKVWWVWLKDQEPPPEEP
jgi:hypothetical protein